jgi:hypothetical protein
MFIFLFNEDVHKANKAKEKTKNINNAFRIRIICLNWFYVSFFFFCFFMQCAQLAKGENIVVFVVEHWSKIMMKN